MDTIEIKLYKHTLDDEWDNAIKKTLKEWNADIIFECKTSRFLGKKGRFGGDWGGEACFYEIKNEGTIVYEKHYDACMSIHLLGFNPKSRAYIKLKNKLEKLANSPIKASWED